MSNIIPLPKKIAAAKPPVKRSELIKVMAHRLIEQGRIAMNKSADELDAEQQAIDKEVLALAVSEKPVRTAKWIVTNDWDKPGHPLTPDRVRVECASICIEPPPNLAKRMVAHHLATHNHGNEFCWLGASHYRLRPGITDENRVMREALVRAKKMLGEQAVTKSDRVAQMLADPEFCKATDAFIKKLSAQPKQLTA